MTDENKIPKGLYCYDIVDGKFTVCPHWQLFNGLASCEVAKITDVGYEDVLRDQVKQCGLNENTITDEV